MRVKSDRQFLVAGLGNILMGDDGAGPHVIRLLQTSYTFPGNVSVVDLGTPGLSLTSYIAGYDSVIIIDTIRAAGLAGDVCLVDLEKLQSVPPKRVSPHDPAVHEALMTVQMLGQAPAHMTLVGIIPQQTAMGRGLSHSVESALSKAADQVIELLRRSGVVPVPSQHAIPDELWWMIEEA